jgi:hypothetical protein
VLVLFVVEATAGLTLSCVNSLRGSIAHVVATFGRVLKFPEVIIENELDELDRLLSV